MNTKKINNTNVHSQKCSDFTIRILRVTFFWDGVQVIGAVLQVGCPLREEIRITQSIWVTSSWTVF